MQRFLRDTCFIGLFLIVIIVAAEIIIPPPENNYSIKRDYIFEHHDEIKTLVIGNSLAEASFNSHILGDSVYCFAISGRALYYDMKLMEQYLQNMHNLKTVILILHYTLAPYPRFNGTNIVGGKYYVFNYYRHMGISTDIFPYGLLYRSFLFSGNFCIHKLNPAFDTCDDIGYVKHDTIWNGEMKHINPPEQYGMEKAFFYMSKMASMLNDQEIRFIVITPPFTNAFLSGCTLNNEKELTRLTDSIGLAYPIEYKNYMHDSYFRNDSLFFDWSHLNHQGATIFAEKVKKDFGL
jgi:hypothetical protein